MGDVQFEDGWLKTVLDDARQHVLATAAVQVAVASNKPLLKEALRDLINLVHDTEPDRFIAAVRQWSP